MIPNAGAVCTARTRTRHRWTPLDDCIDGLIKARRRCRGKQERATLVRCISHARRFRTRWCAEHNAQNYSTQDLQGEGGEDAHRVASQRQTQRGEQFRDFGDKAVAADTEETLRGFLKRKGHEDTTEPLNADAVQCGYRDVLDILDNCELAVRVVKTE